MADKGSRKVSADAKEKALESLAVRNIPHEVSGNRVTVEFRIQDLVNRIGGLEAAGHCSACLGCSGCKV